MLLKDVADRAAAYGMPAEIVDGMDAVAVYLTAQRLVARARAGEGPSMLEAKTYRYYDHQGVKGLRIPYRTQEEIDTWKDRDAITALEQRMVSAGLAAQPELDQVWSDTREEIAAAIKWAEDSPDPDPAHLLDNVFTRCEDDSARDHLRQGLHRIAHAGDGGRRERRRHRRRRGPLRRRVPRLRRAVEDLRREAGHRHPDLRDGLHRDGRRRGRPRPAAGLRPDVLRLHRRCHGPAVQPGGQAEVHVRRRRHGPAHADHGGRAGLSAARSTARAWRPGWPTCRA